jgi:hypothetical protein
MTATLLTGTYTYRVSISRQSWRRRVDCERTSRQSELKFIHVGFSSSRSNYLIFWQCDIYFNNILVVYVANTVE